MLAGKDIREEVRHPVKGTEQMHIPRLVCLSSSRTVSRLNVSSFIQLAWLILFPFGPQGSLRGPFWKGVQQRVLTSGPDPRQERSRLWRGLQVTAHIRRPSSGVQEMFLRPLVFCFESENGAFLQGNRAGQNVPPSVA